MFALFSVIVHAVTVNLSPSISHIFPQHDYQRVYMHAVHTAENEITSREANQPRRKVRFKADGGFWEVFSGMSGGGIIARSDAIHIIISLSRQQRVCRDMEECWR